MKLGIVGSRNRNSDNDFILVLKKVKELNPDEIVSGGCPIGADNFAEKISKQLNISIKIFYPKITQDMKYYDRVKEYYARNKQIAEYSNKLIALISKDRIGGTENTIKYFLKTNNKNNLILL